MAQTNQPVQLIGDPLTYTATSATGTTSCLLPAAIRPISAAVYEQVVITNLGNVDVFAKFTSDPAATVISGTVDRGYPLLARTSQSLTIPVALYAYLVTASGTADVTFQRASGV